MTCDHKAVLFSLIASESGLYELNSEGRLLVDGQLTAWQIEDLLETGRVAEPAVTAVLAEGSNANSETTNEQSL